METGFQKNWFILEKLERGVASDFLVDTEARVHKGLSTGLSVSDANI